MLDTEIVVVVEPPLPDVVVIVSPETEPEISVTISEVGLVGPGGASGSAYAHRQASPSAQWTVYHNLGYFRDPVLFLDDNPNKPVWTDVEPVDANTSIIILPAPATGWAYF